MTTKALAPSNAATQPPVAIGDWWVDPATNELRRGSEIVRVEPKVMEVLMVLADSAGRVVPREALFAAVWPGVVVGDEALTQSVIKLRRALGDNPRAPAYIETVSKRGYRLIARVRQSAVPATNFATPPARKRYASLVAGLALALAIGALLYLFVPTPQPARNADAIDATEGQVPGAITLSVLPFESVGADGEHAYLARGISNDLATELSRIPGLRLIRASEGAPGRPEAKGAAYVVSGSVQRVSETLRINIHLVETERNQQLWSQRFERPFGDLFAVQDEMIGRLTAELPGKLAQASLQRLARRHTRSLAAYDDFLRAQALFLVRQIPANEEARALYRKALEADPKFARAYAGLALTHAMDHMLRPTRESSAALARSMELAQTAQLIDPDLPEVHWTLGFVHAQARRHEQAIAALKRAIALNPSYADAYAMMAGVYTYLGQPAASIPLLRTAMRLNPDGGYLYFMILGRAYLFENDIEQALLNLREAVARNPVNLETRIYLAAALAAAGERSAASWEAEEIRALDAGFSPRAWLTTYPLDSAPHRQRLIELLAAAGL